ncbi:MAG: glycosyl hydrolase family 8 [Sedimentisphaerales bacterium]
MDNEKSTDKGLGAFATGKYRNLFVEAGRSEEQVAEKVDKAFEQLFYGNSNNESVYFSAGTNDNGALAYILDIYHQDVRSEGMSYGMMIAVQLNKKTEFNALWNWARTYMYHDLLNHPSFGYFSWHMKTDGTAIDETPASDGEEYFAMSLYFAAGRWGSGKGIYNYKAAADKIVSDLKNRKVITGSTINGIRTTGSIFDRERKMVLFVPLLEYCCFTDPSYHLPAFYELWALWGPPEDKEFWKEAAQISREFFVKTTNPITGLSPEYANFDGTPYGSKWNDKSVNFGFDAWRTAMNWSMDWAWWGKDERQRQLSDRLQEFFESKDITTYGNEWTLDGKQLDKDHSPGLTAMNATASLAAANPRAQKFVGELWKMAIPSGQQRYYDGMLYMLGMLHCSGQFRIWPPQK